MTKHLNLAALVAAGIAFPVVGANRNELLHAIANAYEGKGSQKLMIPQPIYVNVMHIEKVALEKFRLVSTTGTAFEPAVAALQAVGVPVEPTMGSLMDTLSLDREDMHELVCYCDGIERDGDIMGQRFRNVADGTRRHRGF